MPRMHATRIEFLPSRELRARLEALRAKAEEEGGKKVSMSKLLTYIVEDFLGEEEKVACFLGREE